MPESGISDGWLEAALDTVETAAKEAAEAIAELAGVVARTRDYARSGSPVDLVVRRMAADGMRDRRLAAGQAMQRYESSSLALRAELIRHLVDEEGMSLTEAARMLGVSRQRAARIYSAAGEHSRPDGG